MYCRYLRGHGNRINFSRELRECLVFYVSLIFYFFVEDDTPDYCVEYATCRSLQWSKNQYLLLVDVLPRGPKQIPAVCNVLTLAKLLVFLSFHSSTTTFLISSSPFEKLTPSRNRYTHHIMLHVGFRNKYNTFRTIYSICTKPTLVRRLLRLT